MVRETERLRKASAPDPTKLDGMRCCGFCRERLNVRFGNGEYQYGTLRCGSCRMQV